MKLSIIIPAYNEADRISETIDQTLFYLRRQCFSSEIIVVSDGSSDNTKSLIADSLSGDRVLTRVYEYHPNRGKGYAVRYGMRRGRGEVLLFMDADYSVPISAIEKGFQLLEDGYDVAIGSRSIDGSDITARQNIVREASARLYTFIQNRYLGIRYRDTQCGFKLFTRQTARILFARQRLHSVIFDPEILWLAKKNRFKVAEFPVKWRHVPGSRIQYDSIQKAVFVFQELFKIKRIHR